MVRLDVHTYYFLSFCLTRALVFAVNLVPEGSTLQISQLNPPNQVDAQLIKLFLNAPAPTFSCQDKKDGYYADTQHKCRKFVRCYNDIGYEHWCPKGQAFDDSGGTCIRESEVQCGETLEDSCHNKPDGYYPDFKDGCRKFKRCVDGSQVMSSSCPDGMHFDLRTQACGPDDIVSCNKPQCKDVLDGVNVLLDTHCHAYFTCNKGVASIHRCPPGTAFDVREKICSKEAVTRCEAPDCSKKENGYYTDLSSDCHGYYYCKNGRLKVHKSCPSNYLFNGDKCVPEKDYQCPTTSSTHDDKCSRKSDGFYADTGSGCRNYYYCMDNQMLSYKSCSGDKLFDGSMCVSPNSFSCHALSNSLQFIHSPLSQLDECVDRADGFHWYPDEQCRKYFNCINGKMIASYSCEVGKVFNGAFCVDEGTFSCPVSGGRKVASIRIGSLSLSCKKKSNGYHVLEGSSCKSYIHCIDEEMIGNSLECLPLMRFDPITESCQPSNAVDCVSESVPQCQGKVDGYHVVPETNCNKYFYCKGEQQLGPLISCPAQQVFDLSLKECQAHSQCLSHVGGFDCSTKPEGIYPSRKGSCQEIFTCKNGVTEHFSCSEGMAVDVEVLECVEEAKAKCPFKGGNICLGRDPGIYEDFLNKCKSFAMCSNDGTVLNGLCHEGNIFDSAAGKCLPKDQATCSPMKVTAFSANKVQQEQSSFSCDGKIGFFPEYSDGCRTYHICLPKGRQVMQQCSANYLFDVGIGLCRPSVFVSCKRPSISSANMSCYTEGEMMSYRDDNCRKWLKCTNGTTQLQECDKTQRFDLTKMKCLPKERVPCPQARQNSNNIPPLPILPARPKFRKPTSVSSPFAFKSALNSGFVNRVVPMPPSRRYPLAPPVPNIPPSPPSAPVTLPSRKKVQMITLPPSCINKPDGMYADLESNCKMFHVCMLGTSKAHYCPKNELFDESIHACTEASKVQCGVTKTPVLPNRPKLKHKPKTDINLLLRLNNSVSNPREPIPTGNNTVITMVAPPACDSVGPLYIPDYSAGCRKFQVCSHGELKVYRCPGTLLFNPLSNTCDFANNVICEPWFANLCNNQMGMSQNNGDRLFVVPRSNCRSYYRCHHRKVKLYRCPREMIFDTKTMMCQYSSRVQCMSMGKSLD